MNMKAPGISQAVTLTLGSSCYTMARARDSDPLSAAVMYAKRALANSVVSASNHFRNPDV
jgi:hypothetical protein